MVDRIKAADRSSNISNEDLEAFLQVLGLQQLRARQFRWNVHF